MRELKRALVAEDNRISRLVMREMLAGLGVDVLEAADGEEALELIREHHPDLVVSDVLMPRRDGFALATALQEEKISPRPVLVLTSAVYKHAKWKHEALTTYGAHEFLRKPVDSEALLEVLRKYFDLPGQENSTESA